MAEILYPYGAVGVQVLTFKAASAAIPFGTPVQLSAADSVTISTDALEALGEVLPDESYEADNGTTHVAVGDQLAVALRGNVVDLVCGTTVAVGDHVTLTTGGRLAIPAATALSAGTTPIYGIALEAGTLGNKANVMRL